MTLFKNIITDEMPKTKKEARKYFQSDECIKGKKLKSFEVEKDVFETQTDPYTNYVYPNLSHYNITAVFE